MDKFSLTCLIALIGFLVVFGQTTSASSLESSLQGKSDKVINFFLLIQKKFILKIC